MSQYLRYLQAVIIVSISIFKGYAENDKPGSIPGITYQLIGCSTLKTKHERKEKTMKAFEFFVLVIIPALCTMLLSILIWLFNLGKAFDIIAFILFAIAICCIWDRGMQL